jgi:hypothetical protein
MPQSIFLSGGTIRCRCSAIAAADAVISAAIQAKSLSSKGPVEDAKVQLSIAGVRLPKIRAQPGAALTVFGLLLSLEGRV